MAIPRLSPDLSAGAGSSECRTGSDGGEAAIDRPGRHVVRYRGFVLIPQPDHSWLIRPERSPMRVLPFRAPASCLSEVKALVDRRLRQLSAG